MPVLLLPASGIMVYVMVGVALEAGFPFYGYALSDTSLYYIWFWNIFTVWLVWFTIQGIKLIWER